DTWFSSWLWQFSTMGWPEQTADLKYFFPTSVLVTGPDIIFLWVARMIMASEEIFGVEPFREVYFTGMVRDMKGRKLSKSLGNSPDPLDVIGTYGADALRFTMVSLTPLGGDIRFTPELCETGRNFANKIWNASRLLMMNLPEEGDEFPFTPVDCLSAPPEHLMDRWIASRFFTTLNNTERALKEMRFADATKLVYAFVWNDFCDWYLELIKTRLQSGGEEREQALRHALGVLHGIVRLLHPFMPFITEELYQTLRGLSERVWPQAQARETILFAPFPEVRADCINDSVEEEFSLLQDVVSTLRTIRGELRISQSIRMKAGIHGDGTGYVEFLKELSPLITRLAGLDRLDFDADKPKGSASAVVRTLEVFVPLEGLIDLKAERARLAKERERLTKLVEGARGRLANPKFVENAAEEVVAAERQKLADLESALQKVDRYCSEIDSIKEES
ncbi:MAG: class I tRNA ligase family protein, partial [bacterium]|nr:class I tRNA ligase family protein [bacterium]